MRITFAWLVLVLVPSLVSLAGCTKDNPIYCDQNTPCMSAVRSYCDLDGSLGGVPNRCIDSGDGGRDGSIDAGCTLSSCAAATPICEVAAGMCRACTADTECMTRGGTTPRCGAGAGIVGTCVECATATTATDCTAASKPVCNAATGVCRACQQDGECVSEVCDETAGTCAATDTIIYAAATGTDSGSCGTQASPCRTVTAAMSNVTGTRRIIRLGPGTYTEPGTVSVQNKTVVIIGKGATVKPGVLSASVFLVGDGGNLTLEGVTVSDAAGSGSPAGIRCNANNGIPVLRLIETTVTMNAGRGVDATRCMVSIDRSSLSRNVAGGLSLSDSMYAVQNTFIVDNGNTGSSIGGVRIQGDSMGTLNFATVAQNTSTNSVAPGINCAGNVPTPRLRNNIVFSNLNGTSPSACEWEYSNVQNIIVPNAMNNIADAPMFVDAPAGNYHLMSGSPCKDKADGAGAPMLDFDRDLRPQGGGPDIGADEIKP